MTKLIPITLNVLPALVMIGLIPVVPNDYVLTGIYVLIILAALAIKRSHNDWLVMIFGFLIMTVFEYLFVRTGVETFGRNSLLGLMPLWLPFLWAYGFIAIKRAVEILDTN